MKKDFQEREVVRLWEQLLSKKTELVTEEGEGLKIVYPGRVNDDRGADFRDVVMATGQGLVKGDIEFHVNSRDWQAHRHHHDPAYNRVILHVVMWHNTGRATNLHDGRNIPVLALDKYIKGLINRWPEWGVGRGSAGEALKNISENRSGMPCRKAVEYLATNGLLKVLDCAGEERFLAKVAQFQVALARTEPAQVFYQGIMGALGYAKNKLPFIELARRLPLPVLESIVQGRISDEECLAQQQALLFGTAGLLPSQRQKGHHENKSGKSNKLVRELERLWASSSHDGVMSSGDWHLFKVRPNNSPVRRVAAVSYLILRYREKGILAEVVNLVERAPVIRDHRLEKGLVINVGGYWASHFDFGAGSRVRTPVLLGEGRAADIIVNVVLPFTFAWGKLTSQPGLGEKALTLYHGYPRLAANAVERHMREQLGLSSPLVNSAQRQQGLIHIYNTWCIQGRCDSCPLKRPTAYYDE